MAKKFQFIQKGNIGSFKFTMFLKDEDGKEIEHKLECKEGIVEVDDPYLATELQKNPAYEQTQVGNIEIADKKIKELEAENEKLKKEIENLKEPFDEKKPKDKKSKK